MTRAIHLGDVKTALSLTAMGAVELFCPSSLENRVVGGAAALHVALRGSNATTIDRREKYPRCDVDPVWLEREFLAGVYREMVCTVREHRRRGWSPRIALEGGQRLDAALEDGKGALLWTFPSTFGGLVGKKALHAAGYEVVMLSSHVHPYSGTRFGKRFLNPVRTDVEDRYIVERVVIQPKGATVAMRRVLELLGENKIVEVAAIGDAESPSTFPFLGGTLNLALGAPTMALMSRAPLLPTFSVPVSDDEFAVHIEAPLEVPATGPPRDRASALARAYTEVLERYVLKAPQVWRGWFSRANWSPD